MKEYQYQNPKKENSKAFYLCMEDLAFNDLEHFYLKQSVFYNIPPPPQALQSYGKYWCTGAYTDLQLQWVLCYFQLLIRSLRKALLV